MSTRHAFKVYFSTLIVFGFANAVKVEIEQGTPFTPSTIELELLDPEKNPNPPVQKEETKNIPSSTPTANIRTPNDQKKPVEKTPQTNATENKSVFKSDEFQKEKRLKEVEIAINKKIVEKQTNQAQNTPEKTDSAVIYNITDNQKKWLKSDVKKPVLNRRKYFDKYVVPPNVIQKNNNHLNEKMPTPVFEYEIYAYIFGLIKNINDVNANKIKAAMPLLETKNIIDKYGNSLLMHATNQQNTEMVGLMISQGVSPFLRNYKGTAPIHVAVFLQNINIIRTLCAIEGVANIPDKNGNTPLMYALFKDNKQVVKVLLQNGADPLIENNARENAYYIANYLKKDNWLD